MHGIAYPPLIKGVLIKRHKRFLAEIALSTGKHITAHCPNSGSMLECSEAGRTVYVSRRDNPKRKLKYSWELIEMPASLVGIDTLTPNRLVKAATESGRIEELKEYSRVEPEIKAGDRSRLDFLLRTPRGDCCYIEVKNCTLVNNGIAQFPDAVTARGLKHLHELASLMRAGHRCIMFYLVQRMDAVRFMPADTIDSAYAAALRASYRNGLEILIYDVNINLQGVELRNRIPYTL